MPVGVRGPLVSGWFADHRMGIEFEDELGAETRARGRREFCAWWRANGCRLGPASSIRMLSDAGAGPLLEILGLRWPPQPIPPAAPFVVAPAEGPAGHVPVVVTTWGAGLDRYFTRAAATGHVARCPWLLGFDGRVLRIWDARRGWDRAFVEFELEAAYHDERVFAIVWALARAQALASSTARMAEASARHGTAVCASLRDGVREALALFVTGLAGHRIRCNARHAAAAAAFEQSLTLIYRLLFLLFAESRGLVPAWHRTYRRSYSIEALRARADHPGQHTGIWASLQAISRMAHDGCHAGSLVVTPFNGRLFSPSRTPLAETARLDDELVARAVLAITTTQTPHGRERITFADLGVEQLGAVYESVLDDEIEPGQPSDPPPARPRQTSRVTARSGTGIRRKSSGTFYTPREMTDYLVRRALEPLVAGRTADDILQIKVLDPAMGSGAFLVAACYYLAAAYEDALVQERGRLPGDVTDDDRAHYRRLVARRCLYGVDLNPMAVQVARLSMWLATLAASKPLTFLDHHLSVGNSLVGASLDAVASRPPGGRTRRRRPGQLPLFAAAEVEPALTRALPLRSDLALVPDDHASVIRDKERMLARLRSPDRGLGLWRRLADLWCAGWFWDTQAGPAPAAGVFAEMAAALRGDPTALPAGVLRDLIDRGQRVADSLTCFHWTLEFPEVFYDTAGTPRADAGFDAVVTNPPWDMVRADIGSAECRMQARAHGTRLVAFARQSGTYTLADAGQANLYQLFVERCLSLTKPGGRIGLIVPWGLVSDRGSAPLRAALLERCSLDTLVGFENAHGIFPIHRGVRFLLLSASPGPATRQVTCRFGVRRLSDLDVSCAADGRSGQDVPECVTLTPGLLQALSGPSLAFPYVRTHTDLRLLERLATHFPALASPRGWGLRFGRELNACDDKPIMVKGGPGLPVVEGKHLTPFRVAVEPDGLRVPATERLPTHALRRAVRTWRLAYRDVTGPTNQRTLIAALIPPGHVTVHSALCLKTPVPLPVQAYLCAVLNSFVANFLARLWVTTHLGAGVMARLPAPRLNEYDPDFVAVANLALALRDSPPGEPDGTARLQVRMARLYHLTREEFVHVLEAFPRVADDLRRRCLDGWDTQPACSNPAVDGQRHRRYPHDETCPS
ncbi:MAG: N-6 DNA methylase [Vicinamibacterales bacterium]|nr:N-6 DNA methylase [Vicinamibacterales bacterium]